MGLTQNAEKKGGKLNMTAFEQKAIFSILSAGENLGHLTTQFLPPSAESENTSMGMYIVTSGGVTLDTILQDTQSARWLKALPFIRDNATPSKNTISDIQVNWCR